MTDEIKVYGPDGVSLIVLHNTAGILTLRLVNLYRLLIDIHPSL